MNRTTITSYNAVKSRGQTRFNEAVTFVSRQAVEDELEKESIIEKIDFGEWVASVVTVQAQIRWTHGDY